jgi:hypothetical protein
LSPSNNQHTKPLSINITANTTITSLVKMSKCPEKHKTKPRINSRHDKLRL